MVSGSRERAAGARRAQASVALASAAIRWSAAGLRGSADHVAFAVAISGSGVLWSHDAALADALHILVADEEWSVAGGILSFLSGGHGDDCGCGCG